MPTLCCAVPSHLRVALQGDLLSEGTGIAVTQPRRVAAISLARRVAEETGTTLVRLLASDACIMQCADALPLDAAGRAGRL